MKVYKHKKTGKLYELVQERIMFKDVYDEEYDTDIEGRPTIIIKREFDWRGGKVVILVNNLFYINLYMKILMDHIL